MSKSYDKYNLRCKKMLDIMISTVETPDKTEELLDELVKLYKGKHATYEYHIRDHLPFKYSDPDEKRCVALKVTIHKPRSEKTFYMCISGFQHLL